MHQYRITSARKSGLSINAKPDIGSRLPISPISSVSSTNHGFAGSRISSGRACASEGMKWLGLRNLAPTHAAFARSIFFRGLFRTRLRRGGVSEYQDLRAALDAGERLACHARKNTAGLALG